MGENALRNFDTCALLRFLRLAVRNFGKSGFKLIKDRILSVRTSNHATVRGSVGFPVPRKISGMKQDPESRVSARRGFMDAGSGVP
jgi:hypothetical protein